MYIPKEIQEIIDAGTDLSKCCRSMYSLSKELGECYLIPNDTGIIIFDRVLGSKFEQIKIVSSEVEKVIEVIEAPFLLLQIITTKGNFDLKFSSLDGHKLKGIFDQFNLSEETFQDTDLQAFLPDQLATPKTPEFSAIFAYAASVYSLMLADDHLSIEELQVLEHQLGCKEFIAEAFQFLNTYGIQEIIKQINTNCDEKQKLCILSNLLDIAMIDGTICGKEREMILLYSSELKIDKEHFDTLYNVLYLKNNTAILQK
ncbi:MAG: TerB family tellurite resistance protein [Lentisphaeria bacterium]|nr:TerB family tellurite resistance protein [Lentisphaeria bacterium]